MFQFVLVGKTLLCRVVIFIDNHNFIIYMYMNKYNKIIQTNVVELMLIRETFLCLNSVKLF